MFNASRRRRTSVLQIAAFVLSVSLFAPLVGLTGCSSDEGYGQIPFPSATAEATDGGPRPTVTSDGDDNTSDDDGLSPGTTFVAISAGGHHTCGVREDGTAVCWGNNEQGQSTPVQGKFTAISAGRSHTCAVRKSGYVACWGSNEDPWGNRVGQALQPDGRFTSTSAGGSHTCGVKQNGLVGLSGKVCVRQYRGT